MAGFPWRGLSWLQEGANNVELPADASQKTVVLRLDHGKVNYQGRPLKTDDTDHPDVLTFGDVSLTIIQRDSKDGVRIRDPHAGETRREF